MSNPSWLLAAAVLTSALAAQQNQIADWSWFSLGTGIGNGQLRVSTVGTTPELLVPCGSSGFTSGSRYWVVMRYDAQASNYQQVFVSPVRPETDPIVKLFAQDVLSSPGPEVVVVTRGGTVEIWDETNRALLSTFSAGLSGIQGACLADIDRDGSIDLAVVTQSTLRVVTTTGALVFTMGGVGGVDVVAGQMDADPSMELACTDGRVVDADSRSVQFYWINGFGIDLEAADIDGDGMDEVVAAESWNWLWAYDIDTQLPKWSIPVFDLDCIAIGNVDQDANLEVLVGDGQWGDVEAFDTVTQVREWGIHNPEHGVTSVAIGDLDGDGQLEVIWGAGFTSTGPDILFVADASTRTIEWQSVDIGGPFVGPEFGDVDGDGNEEMVVGASQNGSTRLMFFDPATRRQEFMSSALATSYSSSMSDLSLVDVDGDGQKEILVVNGSVTLYGYANGALTVRWQVPSSISPSLSYRVARIADLDGNGTLEAVLGSNQFVHVRDYATNTELWRSFYVGGPVKQLLVAQSDADPGLELHALSEDGNIYVFDGATRTPQAILQDGGVNRTAIGLLPSGLPGLLAGDQNGNLFAILYSGPGYQTLGPLPLVAGPIDGLDWIDGTGFYWLANGGRVRIMDGITPAWSTADYGTGFGSRTRIDFTTLTLNATGQFGVSSFDLR